MRAWVQFLGCIIVVKAVFIVPWHIVARCIFRAYTGAAACNYRSLVHSQKVLEASNKTMRRRRAAYTHADVRRLAWPQLTLVVSACSDDAVREGRERERKKNRKGLVVALQRADARVCVSDDTP